MQLLVRTASVEHPIVVDGLVPTDTVAELIRRFVEVYLRTGGRLRSPRCTCRLLSRGRFLSEGETLSGARLESGDHLHAVFREEADPSRRGSSATSSSLEADSAPRGLDRLLGMGFSQNDVSFFRNQFLRTVQPNAAQGATPAQRIEAEERFFEDVRPGSSTSTAPPQPAAETPAQPTRLIDPPATVLHSVARICGAFVGFFLGLAAVPLLTSLLNVPMQFRFGIFVGIALNIFWAIQGEQYYISGFAK